MKPALLVLLLVTVPAAASNLRYSVSSPMAKNHGPGWPHTGYTGWCQGDQDGDCLDDAVENELAQKLNPRYFLDEDEDCPLMYLYTQVRPAGHGVDTWRVDGRVKQVQVTYFFLYPRDCKSIGGHNGDSEHVRYYLSSQNLDTWTLDRARYWRHDDVKEISGDHLYTMTHAVSGTWGQLNIPPIVAADEDGHGSWEGETPYDSHCAAGAATYRDCFDASQARFSTYRINTILHNVGGPNMGRAGGPEQWRTGTSHLIVQGSEVYTPRNGLKEFWQPRQNFCGWNCYGSACGGCSSPLDEKVDRSTFSRQSRPITAPENGGAAFTYDCTFTRNGGTFSNFNTWTFQGQLPQGHLLYTVTDFAGTHYYRLWYSHQINAINERYILESVNPWDWSGPAIARCDYFDVGRQGHDISFSGPAGVCTTGVQQFCTRP